MHYMSVGKAVVHNEHQSRERKVTSWDIRAKRTLNHMDVKRMNLLEMKYIYHEMEASHDHKSAKESVASTSNFSMPGSREEWPASGTM